MPCFWTQGFDKASFVTPILKHWMLKRHPHTPPHLFVDETPYFVTGGIYQKRPLLAEPEIKNYLLELLQTTFQQYDWELHHWVILDNHYHVLGRSRRGEDLTRIFRAVHSQSAIVIRQTTNCARPVWWNYWDYCPRDERDYLVRLNYLLYNPMKHGYVTDLRDYTYSSFHQLIEDVGREQLASQFRGHPEYRGLVLHEAKRDDF